MVGRPRKVLNESNALPVPLQGQRLVQPLPKSLEQLHDVGPGRDRAGNRQLFFDQYIALLLRYFFTLALDSLRGLQQATGWEKTRQKRRQTTHRFAFSAR